MCFDADNLVSSNFIGNEQTAMQSHKVIQGYIDSKTPMILG